MHLVLQSNDSKTNISTVIIYTITTDFRFVIFFIIIILGCEMKELDCWKKIKNNKVAIGNIF